MKTTIAIAAIAATTAFTAAPANAQMTALKSFDAAATVANGAIVHKTGRRGRRIGAGIALGILGAAAIAGHAYGRDYDRDDRYSRHERRCNRWRRWCRNGDGDACWKYDNRC